MACFRRKRKRKYKRYENSQMPFASLEILICTFDLDHSLMLERQISDGRFPSLRRLQMPIVYCLDTDGRIHRAVCALERTMKSQISKGPYFGGAVAQRRLPFSYDRLL